MTEDVLKELRAKKLELMKLNIGGEEFCRRMNLLVDDIRVYDPSEPYWVHQKVDFNKWSIQGTGLNVEGNGVNDRNEV